MKLSELFLKSTVAQIVVDETSPARNKTLRDLNLRQQTGATIIAVIRDDQAITNPDAGFELKEGDMMVLWGAHQQLADAEKMLISPAPL